MEVAIQAQINVLIDDDLVHLLDRPGWRLNAEGYVCVTRGTGILFLHHLVLGITPTSGLRVDHRNRNKLDNRRENLRVVTPSQNAQNREPIRQHDRCSSRYRGVSWKANHRPHGKWVARATINYRTHHIGYFDSEEEAAAAAAAWRAANMPYSEADQGQV